MRIGLVTILLLHVITGTLLAVEDCPSHSIEEWGLPIQVRTMWVGPADTLYGFQDISIWRSVDRGESWTEVHRFPSGGGVRCLFVDSRHTIFASRDVTGRLQMGKYGASGHRIWSQPLGFQCGEGFWHMCEDPSGNLFVGEYAGSPTDTCAFIYGSTDGGDTWNMVYAGTGRHIHFVAADPYTGYLYASIGDGNARSELIRSTDTGRTWETILSGECFAQPISVAFTPSQRIFGSDCGGTGATNYIYSTADDSTFVVELVLDGDESTFVWSMSKNREGVLFAGTTTRDAGNAVPGIYMSRDDGEGWCRVKTWGMVALPYRGVDWMSNFDSDGYAYYHDGVTHRSFSFRDASQTTSIPTEPDEARAALRVSAHPNPFTAATDIDVDADGHVGDATLRVYDARGRFVRQLFEGKIRAGTESLRWNGTDCRGLPAPSGVYFLKLELDGETACSKIVILH